MLLVTPGRSNESVFQSVREINDRMDVALRSASLRIGRQIQQDIRKDMRGKKSGNRYTLKEFWKGDKFITHRASAPGEAPAVLTGSLAASVGYKPSSSELVVGAGNTGGGVPIVKRPKYANLNGQIAFGRTVNYALKLETIMQRPYLSKHIRLNQRNTTNYFYRQIAIRVFRV